MNLEKVKGKTSMSSPKIVKKVHRLNDRIATLRRFMSKGGDRCKYFFRLLKSKSKKKDRIGKCDEAFTELMKQIG